MTSVAVDPRAQVAEWVIEGLARTAEWRREKAEEHSDDGRNIAAAETCERLAGLAEVSAETAAQYMALIEHDGHRISEAESEVLRRIGFQSSPSALDDVIAEIVREATPVDWDRW